MLARPIVASLAVLGCLSALVAPRAAEACGGCFAPQDPPTVVSGHRMVMSVSPQQSVLWDQIQYSGDPEEFAWVLPIKRGARVEASTAAFFEVFEATTAVRVVPPPLNCGGGSGSGCGASLAQSDAAGDGDGGEDPNTVEVLHRGTVGPYETVTLATDEPGALNTWLADHGFAVDPSTQPVIDQYVAEDFDFIALRLQPGKGIQEMTPVRVVTEGSSLSLPLRMVAAGTGAQTPIVLYVIGEGRYTVSNFAEAKLETSLLSWNFKTSSSNYEDLRLRALQANGGRSFLPTFASQGLMTGYFFDPSGFGDGQQLLQTYAGQALSNGEISQACSVLPLGYDEQRRVVQPCPAGEPWDSPLCGQVESDELDARELGCEGLDDFAVALTGLHPNDVWVTRLEATLPRSALDTDLIVGAHDDQSELSNLVQASIAVEAEGACPSFAPPVRFSTPQAPTSPLSNAFVLGLSGAALAWAARRILTARARAS